MWDVLGSNPMALSLSLFSISFSIIFYVLFFFDQKPKHWFPRPILSNHIQSQPTNPKWTTTQGSSRQSKAQIPTKSATHYHHQTKPIVPTQALTKHLKLIETPTPKSNLRNHTQLPHKGFDNTIDAPTQKTHHAKLPTFSPKIKNKIIPMQQANGNKGHLIGYFN